MYTNISYRNIFIIFIIFLFQGCISHDSPHPHAHLAPIKPPKEDSTSTKMKIVYFAHDSYTLDNKAKKIVDDVAKDLIEHPNKAIIITGQASHEGYPSYNLVLSRSRASAVVNYLIHHGVNRSKIIKINALGDKKPVCKENNEACYKLNRRVTITSDSTLLQKKEYELIDTRVRMLHQSKSKQNAKAKLLALHKEKHQKYVIRSGDMFNFSVYGERDLTAKRGVVKPDGTLTIPMIGDVKISGLTVNEAMQKISKQMHNFLQDAVISLLPVEFKAQSYTILGKINKPGRYPIQEGTRLIDAIAESGDLSIGLFQGSTIELADLEHAFIRRDLDVLPVDFTELVRKGNPLHNIPLEDHDYIYIPSALNTEVYILGEVNSAGYFGFKEHMTLTQLVSYAGGFKESAKIENVAILRGYIKDPSVYIVNLQDVIEGKRADFMLEPFDIVFIPRTYINDFNTLINIITPALGAITDGYIAKQLLGTIK